MTVTVDTVFDTIKVRFDDILHLCFYRSKFLGLTSWIHESKYCIELTMTGGTMLCEYDDLEKFTAVLAGLDKIL